MRAISLAALLLAAGLGQGVAHGTEGCEGWWPWLWGQMPRPSPTCPDDYCRKPLPCVAPVKNFGPDDYCRKPLPCVVPVKDFGPDDYCRKPLPPWPPSCFPPWYTCGPKP